MSYQRSITLADYRGVKIRTATGKRFYVVISDGEDKAKVIKRTDSAVAVTRELERWIDTVAYAVITTNGIATARVMTDEQVVYLAKSEKRAKAQRKAEVARWGH